MIFSKTLISPKSGNTGSSACFLSTSGRGTMLILSILFLHCVVNIAGQDGEEVKGGINFCDRTVMSSCYCETKLKPVLIDCSGLKLKVLYEEEDWNVTLAALNITADEPIEVNFSDNLLEDIPMLPPLNIVMLFFHQNRIKKIYPSAFSHLPELDTLDLSSNKLNSKALEEGIFYGQFNSSHSAPGYFPLPLKHLNMSHNKIHSIGSRLMDHLTSLKGLDLAHNPLELLGGSSSTAGAISGLTQLEYLGLSHTKINSISDGMLHNLVNLMSLDLSGNKFTKVPEELQYAHRLINLNLDSNKIQTLNSTSFVGLDYLQDLSISHMDTLKEIGNGTFGSLKNLMKLQLTFNRRLNKLHNDAFFGITKTEADWPVKDMRLNDNGLTHIDRALAAWEFVDYVDIQNNPFRCDCNLDWMVSELVDRIRRAIPQNAEDLVCAEPKMLKGKAIKDLADDPDIFSRCQTTGSMALDVDDFETPSGGDPYKSAGFIALLTGMMLIIIALATLGFIFVKRRAIAQSLTAPSQIRYERADTEEDEFGDGSRRYTGPSSIFK